MTDVTSPKARNGALGRRVRGFGVLGCRPRREQAHCVVRRSAGLDRVDEQELVLVGQPHRLEVDFQLTDDGVAIAFRAGVAGGYVVLGHHVRNSGLAIESSPIYARSGMALRRHAAHLPQQRHRQDRDPRQLHGRAHAPIDSLDDSFAVEEYHHFCLNVGDVDATLAELRSRGVEVLGDAIDLEAIDRRLGFFKDNNDNVIELASPLRGRRPD